MGNTTFSGPVRSKNGFQTISVSAGGVETVVATDGTGAAPSPTDAGTGITAGTGTVHAVSVTRNGSLIETRIFMDLTGLNSGGTAADIIGVAAAANCHIGQITEAVNGTIVGGYMRCLEVPTGGDPDINLYAADEATGVEDTAITALTNDTILVNSGDLTLASMEVLDAFPAANQYLYLVTGDATDDTYTAGKIEIVLFGTA